MDIAMGGMIRQIPLSSVAKIDYSNTYGGVKRLQLKRVITLSSEVLAGYAPTDVVQSIMKATENFRKKQDIEISFTGEKEEQEEAMSFLSMAMIITIGIITFVLITQFNSLFQTILILSEVIFSIIGVLLGIIIFNMSISIIMTGLGIVALGGIVVRNGILIIEFANILRERGVKLKDAVIQAGMIRTTPVMLTSIAVVLGLIPLAVGFNINFITMFTELNPQIHFGGDNVMFWGPLSWTIIFGLSFSTFLTLVFVPVIYYMYYNWRANRNERKLDAIAH
jgi:multidrug efflux pump subunit AcrB